MIIDTNRRTTRQLTCLKNAGVSAILRYYARFTQQPEKRLTRREAEAIISSGLNIGIVHQASGDYAAYFSRQSGLLDGAYARNYAATVIGQPARSAIYFGVDYNADEDDVEARIVPYFQAIIETFAPSTELPEYKIGVYGNGLVCRTLLDRSLVSYTWLSQSRAYNGAPEFKRSKRWTLLQHLGRELCHINIEPNDLNEKSKSFGEFSSLESKESLDATAEVPSNAIGEVVADHPAQVPDAYGASIGDLFYSTRQGDTLPLIARHFQIDLDLLLYANPHVDPQSAKLDLETETGVVLALPSLTNLEIAAPALIQESRFRPQEAPWFAFAQREMEMGVEEVPGSAANVRIIEYFQTVRPRFSSDEVSWCSAFVNWCVTMSGIRGTNSPAARSWLNWGEDLHGHLREGCILVFWRGSPTSWKGHVGFYYGPSRTRGYALVLGGNQANPGGGPDQVNVSERSLAKLIGARWPGSG